MDWDFGGLDRLSPRESRFPGFLIDPGVEVAGGRFRPLVPFDPFEDELDPPVSYLLKHLDEHPLSFGFWWGFRSSPKTKPAADVLGVRLDDENVGPTVEPTDGEKSGGGDPDELALRRGAHPKRAWPRHEDAPMAVPNPRARPPPCPGGSAFQDASE